MSRLRTIQFILFSSALGLLLFAGCGSDEKAKDKTPEMDGPRMKTTKEGELVVQEFTLDSDEKPDVIKYFEEYPDPEDESVTKRRLRKKEVDVNSDGSIDIIRTYDKEGVPKTEQIDVDLDGTRDVKNYFDNGSLVRKELFADDGKTVAATRHYNDGKIIRIEKDQNGDGKTDYWEFYEQGTLDRIGRDLNGDERADTWTKR